MALAKIVYASMTGNTEEIADIVAKKLEELGHTVDVDECTTVDAADFEDADICIVATYTYGDGELPDEIVDFYEDLADLDLSGKIFGVVGSGDTFYDYFCHSVDEFVDSLEKVLSGQVDKRDAGDRVAQSRSIDLVADQLVKAYQQVLEM